MIVGPATGALVFLIGGTSALATFVAYRVATKTGPDLTLGDMRPCLPWEGLPLPRFVYTKPELLDELKKR